MANSDEDYLRGLEERYGVSSSDRASDLQKIAEKNPEDREQFLRDLEGQYQRRGSNVPGGSQPQQTSGGGGGGGDDLNYQDYYNRTLGNQQNMFPDWLRGLYEKQDARAEADIARRQQSEDAIRSTLMSMIEQGQQPVTAESIALSPEGRSFARLQDRAADALRAQAAERAAVRGIGGTQAGELGGALASQAAGGAREAQENIAAQQSQIMARELQAKRQQLMQALQMGAGLLSGDQQRELQREVSRIDSAIRQNLGQGQLSLGLLGSLLQNEQFNTNLGAQLGMFNAGLNQGFYNNFWG